VGARAPVRCSGKPRQPSSGGSTAHVSPTRHIRSWTAHGPRLNHAWCPLASVGGRRAVPCASGSDAPTTTTVRLPTRGEERRIGQVGNPILRRASRPDRAGATSHQKEEEKRRTIHQSLLACSLAAPSIIRESPPNRRQQLGLTSQPCVVAGAAKKKTATPMHAGAGALEAFCAVPSDDAICHTRAKSRRHCRRCAFFSLFAD
jgi:hypothetical protein